MHDAQWRGNEGESSALCRCVCVVCCVCLCVCVCVWCGCVVCCVCVCVCVVWVKGWQEKPKTQNTPGANLDERVAENESLEQSKCPTQESATEGPLPWNARTFPRQHLLLPGSTTRTPLAKYHKQTNQISVGGPVCVCVCVVCVCVWCGV